MTESGPVERVVDLLASSGYKRLGSSVPIAGVPFEFNAVLVADDRAFDLVIVADTIAEPDRRLRQKVEALARALDVSGSRRSVTLVTVGPRPPAATLESLSRVARILVVPAGSGGSPNSVADALAILLPLQLPSASEEAPEPFGEVYGWLKRDRSREELEQMMVAAARGPAAVSEALASYLSAPLTEVVWELRNE